MFTDVLHDVSEHSICSRRTLLSFESEPTHYSLSVSYAEG